MVLHTFDETISKDIDKSVKATIRFYKQLREASIGKGEQAIPPSFEAFTQMAFGLMRASKEVQMYKLRTQPLRDVLEQAWTKKLQNYAVRQLMRETYEKLISRF